MAKLAEVTSEVRIILKILGSAAALVLLIFIAVRGSQIAKDIFFPAPPAPPEAKFGQLPKVLFPLQNPVNIKYRINTLNGQLPATGTLPGNLPDRMQVFKVKAPTASLVALATVRQILKNARFDTSETKINESVYRWTNTTGTAIQYNIINNNFRITSNFLGEEPPTILAGLASNKEGAHESAVEFLQSIQQDTTDIDSERTVATYLKIQNGTLVEATSQNDAQFIRVDLFQKALADKNIYYAGFNQSPMYFIFRNSNDNPRIVEANYFHYSADPVSSEYGIKTSDKAFEDLTRGKAYIKLDNKEKSEIDITDVDLGYYIGENPEYFLPIYIFSGTGITAYVNALSDQ